MYRTVNDFLTDWTHSAEGTLRVFESLSDDKLDQAIVQGHSTLGWLGWHLTTTPVFFMSLVGIKLESSVDPKVVPTKANEIVDAYKKVAEDVKQAVETIMTDEKLLETVDSFGGPTPRGALLRMFIDHQTHHRGQMTVLLRQAGLPVPGVMGPTKEESL